MFVEQPRLHWVCYIYKDDIRGGKLCQNVSFHSSNGVGVVVFLEGDHQKFCEFFYNAVCITGSATLVLITA